MKKFLLSFMAFILALSSISCSTGGQKIYFDGTVKVDDITNIVIDFPASVVAVKVKEGQKVKKGDVLVSLDFSDYNRQIESQQRQLDIANLELQSLLSTAARATTSSQNGLNILNNDIKNLYNSLTYKQQALENNTDPDIQKCMNDLKYSQEAYTAALNELSNKNKLFQSGAISKSELDSFNQILDGLKKAADDAKFALDTLKKSKQNEIDELRSAYEAKLLQLDNQTAYEAKLLQQDNQKSRESNANINIQKAKIQSLQADIKGVKDKLNKEYLVQKDIVSVVNNGVVYDIGYAKGDIVNANKKILSILNLDNMFIAAKIPQDLSKNVKMGMDVKFTLLADNTKTYTGKVIYISGKAVKDTDETILPVVISIDNKDDFLRPDLDVNIIINVEP